MTFTKRCTAVLAGLLLCVGVLAAPVDVAGVKLADPIELAAPNCSSMAQAFATRPCSRSMWPRFTLTKRPRRRRRFTPRPGAKRMSITLLREIDSNELGKSFTKAFEENAPKDRDVQADSRPAQDGPDFFRPEKNAARAKTSPSTGFPARAP